MKVWAALVVCVFVAMGWGASATANPVDPADRANLAIRADQSQAAGPVAPLVPAGQPNPANPPSPPDRAGQENAAEPAGARPTSNLRLAAPLVPQAVPLLGVGESALFQKAGVGTSFSLWRSPEQLRALVANGQVDAVVAALPTAAVLARRGVPCVVLAAYAAPLWLVGPPNLAREGEPPLDTLRRLLDREILLPFGPGNMPELALRVLAAQGRLDCPLRHCGSALEAVNLLRLGQGGAGLLPEPSASLATAGGGMIRLLDLREAWSAAFPEHTDMPTACLMVVGATARDPALRALLRQGFVEGMCEMENNPQASLMTARRHSPELGAVLERAATEERPFMSSAVLVGERGKKAALFMLQRLLELTPTSVGGSLPTNDFWDMGREE